MSETSSGAFTSLDILEIQKLKGLQGWFDANQEEKKEKRKEEMNKRMNKGRKIIRLGTVSY